MKEINELLPYVKLKMAVESPTLESCYIDGYLAMQAEIAEESDPFNAGSSESEMWLQGWWAAFYGEEPLFDLKTEKYNPKVEGIIKHEAANDSVFASASFGRVVKVAGAIAATAFLGYQVMDMMA